jgi:hypothetical protein
MMKDQKISMTEMLEYIDGYIEDLKDGVVFDPDKNEFDRGYIEGMKIIRDDLEGWISKKNRKIYKEGPCTCTELPTCKDGRCSVCGGSLMGRCTTDTVLLRG